MTDIPGLNTELRPEKAPVWMRKLVDNVHAGNFHSVLGDRHRAPASDRGRQAAVLMLFAGTETSATLPNDAAVLLTHRSPLLRSHSGQVAFPGGRLDAEDINPVDCALREAWEETGLDRRSVTPLAQLEEVHIRATGYPVHPVVGHWHTRTPVGVVRPEEADEVFDVPVLSLIDPSNRLSVGWGSWSGPAFRVNDYVIWGFTGGLLAAALHQAGWEEPWDRDNVQDLRETLAKSRNNERIL